MATTAKTYVVEDADEDAPSKIPTAVFPGSLCHLLLREVKCVGEFQERIRLLDGIEIFALQVLHQCHFKRHFVGHVPDNYGDPRKLGTLSRSPATLTGDKLKAIRYPSDYQRLDDSARANGLREFSKGLFAKASSWLVRARVN